MFGEEGRKKDLGMYSLLGRRRQHQAPLFMSFRRQEYWSGVPFAYFSPLHDPCPLSITAPPNANPDTELELSKYLSKWDL